MRYTALRVLIVFGIISLHKCWPAAAEDVQYGPVTTVRVDGFTLHVPQNYFNGFDGYQYKSGYLSVRALLPCLEPETPENTAEFHKNTLGNTITLKISELGEHDLTGEPLLTALLHDQHPIPKTRDDPAYLPGFELYRSDVLSRDIFVRRDVDPPLVLVCFEPSSVPFPSCSQRETMNGSLLLEYRFSRSFIAHTPHAASVIDRNVRNLVTAFLTQPEGKKFNDGVCE
jgi:hypothetical protein